MSLEETIAQAVKAAVQEALAPLQAELQKIRLEREEEGVSLEDAARRLHVSVKTVRRMVQRGDLEAVPGMRPPRVLLSEVLAKG